MLKMYGYLPVWGLSDMSPYVSFTDAYLRMAQIPFVVEMLHQGDLTKTPKGKLPWIIDRDGTSVSDSQLIHYYLEENYGGRLDGWLTREQKATSTLIHRMLGECWYWMAVQTRYRRDEDFRIYDPLWVKFLSWLPVEQRREPVRIFRERLLTQFWHHGTGRNSEAEVELIARHLTDAMSDLLGDKPFVFGDRPSSLDANLYAQLVHVMFTPFPSPIGQYCRSKPNLAAYTARIFDASYPELREDREEAAAYLQRELAIRKPYGEDSDHMLEELFKGRVKT
ncbi:MAG: glutathione S-transferase family protein [Salinisphaera sp.]|nr:glutathione S-transferase family protein [Salinisphaera sp.]